MPFVDDLRVPCGEEDLERRRFLALLGSGALGLTGVGMVVAVARYLEPDVLDEGDGLFEVGRPETLPVGTVLVSRARQVYVVHAPAGFYALSAVCTHLGCVTKQEQGTDRIVCPCHGSTFDVAGRVVSGPAKKQLRRLSLTLRRGVLVVDTGRPAADDSVLEV